MSIGKKIGIGFAGVVLTLGVPMGVYALLGHPDTSKASETAAPGSPAAATALSVDGAPQASTGSDASGDVSPDSPITLTINGQPVDVPENGSSHQTLPNDAGGTTSVSVTNQTDSTTRSAGNTSVNLNISSSTTNTSGTTHQTQHSNTSVHSTTSGKSTL